jgi:hypothetical protein
VDRESKTEPRSTSNELKIFNLSHFMAGDHKIVSEKCRHGGEDVRSDIEVIDK